MNENKPLTLTQEARLAEIDRLLEIGSRERNKLNDEILAKQARRDAMLVERDQLRDEQLAILRGVQ